jgi:pyruvate dehydrogenase E1 component
VQKIIEEIIEGVICGRGVGLVGNVVKATFNDKVKGSENMNSTGTCGTVSTDLRVSLLFIVAVVGEMIVSMAHDVGTSTNLNPTMDGKIFGAEVTEDLESQLQVKDRKTPDLVPHESQKDRFIRFDIAEANVMSCMGSFGRLRDTLGIPILPLMTVYDFFVKRALDQYFYELYWKSSFILVGTPSGVTLSPEGAQHGWKSDIQIPNQITWEPLFCQELDWILCDSIRRHMLNENEGRNGVFIRGVTLGIEQKDFLKHLRRQKRFKVGLSEEHLLHHKDYEVGGAYNESQLETLDDEAILETIKHDVLAGGYKLIDYSGYAGYEPGDNVVNIFAMGAMGVEAMKASESLLARGIYANVIMVSSPDLLIGNLGKENDFFHLKHNLGVNANLHLLPQLNGNLTASEIVTISGRRTPIVSVHDGEPGLLDNIGSIVGVRHECLAVRKHSKCGRPKDVYQFHGIDAEGIIEASGKVLSETALEEVRVSAKALLGANEQPSQFTNWRELWPQRSH